MKMEETSFLILVVVRIFGVGSAASDKRSEQRRKAGGDPMGEGNGEEQLGRTRRQRKVRIGTWKMQKPSITVRCTSLNGSAWSTRRSK